MSEWNNEASTTFEVNKKTVPTKRQDLITAAMDVLGAVGVSMVVYFIGVFAGIEVLRSTSFFVFGALMSNAHRDYRWNRKYISVVKPPWLRD